MRAAVIEDQTLMRDYFAALLRKRCGATEVVAISSMAELARREAELTDVELVLFDIDLGDGSTVDWAVTRATTGGAGAMVAVSSIGAQFPFKRLQAAGISLAHKNDSEKELVDLIQRARSGAMIVSRRVMDLIGAAARDPHSPLKILGPREQQVLGLLGQRLTNDEVAAVLGCTPENVVDHRHRIMRKLNLHSIEQLIECAIRHGLVFDSQAAAARPRSTS